MYRLAVPYFYGGHVYISSLHTICNHSFQEFCNASTCINVGVVGYVSAFTNFFHFTEYHEQCLKKVFKKSAGETKVTVALAEHLLGKLAQGDSYSIDSKMKLKGPTCPCGCDKKPSFFCTGIGKQF